MRTIKQLCSEAFSCVNFDWREYVVTDPRFVRPIEAGPTVADASKALRILGWEPKTSFTQVVAMMVDNHLNKIRKDGEH
ncbi:MAG: GDP-mannose 4,6-dehydratase [Nitrososphaera sp.]